MRKCDKVFGHNFLNIDGKDLLTPYVEPPKAYLSEDNSHKKDVRHILPVDEWHDIFPTLKQKTDWEVQKRKHKRSVHYAKLNIAFDIETYSFIMNGKKCACMYSWQIAVNFKPYIGRTRDELFDVLNYLCVKYNLNEERRVIIWVHNLSYEFEFLRKWLFPDAVFSRKRHNVMRCMMLPGVEFRCTYVLSGTSLSAVANNLTEYWVRKTKERFDYRIARGSLTPLTDDEIKYCVNDVIIVNAYIEEQRKMYGSLHDIPMTNTGRVRRYCKEHVGDKAKQVARELKCNSSAEYKLWNDAFTGGFTHGNQFFAGETLSIIHDSKVDTIHCYDFTSSYPAVLVYENKYPMSTGTKVKLTRGMLEDTKTKKKCYIFRVRFTNIRQKKNMTFATPLSKSKCRNFVYTGTRNNKKNDDEYVEENNGKIISFVGTFETAMTDVDFFNIDKFYEWDNVEFGSAYEFFADYLPEGLVKCIIHFFKEKTYWKKKIKEMKKAGATSAEIAQASITMMVNKGMLNSTYGMCVQKLIESVVDVIGGEWNEDMNDLNSVIEDYNKSTSRFLFFPWGIFCTAFARRNLLNLIEGVGYDFIYADTDSVTYFSYEKHEDFFNSYNKWCWKKLKAASQHFALTQEELDYLLPGDADHIKSAETLGMVDSDKWCYKFKHMGCKRYIYTDMSGNIHCTVAGVSKAGLEKMMRIARRNYKDPYDIFKENMYVPPEYCNKQCLYYPSKNEENIEGDFVDYLGTVNHFREYGFIYMEPTDYRLGISEDYERILYGDYHDDTY